MSAGRVAALAVVLVGLLATVPFAWQRSPSAGEPAADASTAEGEASPAAGQAPAPAPAPTAAKTANAGGPATDPGRNATASPGEDDATQTTLSAGDGRYLAVEAVVDSLEVFATPGDATPARRLANPNPAGATLVLAAIDGRPGWLQVLLPVRPNGSTGWVRLADVDVVRHAFRIEIRLAERQLTVFDGDEVIQIEPIGVGRQPTPTPGGSFYLYELLRPTDPSGPYGPLAFGLSGFSEALDSFNGGDGRLGIHGTDDPTSLGADSTSGCIRLANPAIEQLARTVPIGTPVMILS